MPTSIPVTRYTCKKTIGPRGLVLLELLIVVTIIGLLATIAGLNFTNAFARSKFENEVHGLINTLKMAQNASAGSTRRYAVVIDFNEQTYSLRQYKSLEMDEMDEEDIDFDKRPVLSTIDLSDRCRVEYVLFDNGLDTRIPLGDEDLVGATFHAGRWGWMNGGKIVLSDNEGMVYSIMINRLGKLIELKEGDVEIMMPMNQEDVSF